MIKTAWTDDDKKLNVGLGLQRGNFERLKEDQPIAFPAMQVKIPDNRHVLILYRPENVEPNPELFNLLGEKFMVVIALEDGTISNLLEGKTYTLDMPSVKFHLFFEKDDEGFETLKYLSEQGLLTENSKIMIQLNPPMEN